MFVLPLISARFKDSHTKPYFEGIVECIKYHDLPKMYVPYELTERYDKRLAITIRDQSPRFYTLALSFFFCKYRMLVSTEKLLCHSRIHNDLKQSFVRYLAHHGFDLSTVEDNAELYILGLPKPKRLAICFLETSIICSCLVY